MMEFVAIALGMAALALCFVLPVLLRKQSSSSLLDAGQVNEQVMRDQLHELDSDRQAGTLNEAAHESAKRELVRRLVEQKYQARTAVTTKQTWLAFALALAVPLTSLCLYQYLGTGAALDPKQRSATAQDVGQEQILAMVQRLAAKLKQQPGDAEGWAMLARSYFELGRYQDAADAYAHLTQLVPDNADNLASYALTLALSQNRNLQGEPVQLLQRAVQIDPKNIRALSLLGSAAFDRHDYAEAIRSWEQVLPLVPAESEIARSTQGSIDEAQALLKDSARNSVLQLPGDRLPSR
ncbi:cytochrome c-type biogenesis protein CcmH [Oxalobacteraceae bacterium GrIS 2.11]